MVTSKTILSSLPKCLMNFDFAEFGKKESGKVRDFYVSSKYRIIVTTDRQSAFDRNLGFIPFKGAVLNQLASFWFDKTKKIIANHKITLIHPNVLVAKNLKGIPVEMIVRGYMTGVTGTAIWPSYQRGERVIYGIKFPDGLKKNQKLPLRPIITPTTHGGGKSGHDDRLTKKEIIGKKIVNKKIYEQMEKAALALFDMGSTWCKKKGLILVDTKYEFGLDEKGNLTLMDEVHTPDSSRFWIAKTYKSRFDNDKEPDNFDKEFLRLWYKKRGYTGDGVPPKMSKELIVDLSKRYISVYEMITGKKFRAYKYPAEKEIKNAIKEFILKR